MRSYGVAFIGHRRIEHEYGLEDCLEEMVMDLLHRHEFVEFYVGRNGDFDVSAAAAVKRAQRRFGTGSSSLNLVLPYRVKDEEHYVKYYDEIMYPIGPDVHFKAAITKRNEWMINQANLVIAYVKQFTGGANTALEYAKARKVDFINIAYS